MDGRGMDVTQGAQRLLTGRVLSHSCLQASREAPDRARSVSAAAVGSGGCAGWEPQCWGRGASLEVPHMLAAQL